MYQVYHLHMDNFTATMIQNDTHITEYEDNVLFSSDTFDDVDTANKYFAEMMEAYNDFQNSQLS